MNDLPNILKTSALCLMLGVLFVACDKDDDAGRNEKEGVLYFRGFSETQVLFWVGGEPRDPSGLDMSEFFNSTRLSWISALRYADHTFFFDGDTVEIFAGHQVPPRHAYTVENDTVWYFIENWFADTPSKSCLAEGSATELRQRHGLMYRRYLDENGVLRRGGGFEVSRYNTPELMEAQTSFTGIDQMAETDTLLIINQTKLFN